MDLVCIDPPFAKNDTFRADNLKPPLTDEEDANEYRLMSSWGIRSEREAEQAGIAWPATSSGGYKDIWSWESDIHEDWFQSLDASYRGVSLAIEEDQEVDGDSVAAYLCYMAVRLIEIHRVLKSSGSIYLHCDNTANAYLRLLMSSVFGAHNFQNHIFWRRAPGRSGGRSWGHTHDTILHYTKSEEYVWNDTFIESGGSGTTNVPLTAAGVTKNGESGTEWRGYDPTRIGRHRSVPRTGSLADWIESNIHPGFKSIVSPHARLEVIAKAGLVNWSDSGTPTIRRPAEADVGIKVNDVWTDIKLLSPTARERTGYPTQKPIALAERMIAASSNPGDIVLDCFAGCASAGVAAERLHRRWVACDLNIRAWTVFKRQFNKPHLALLRCNDSTRDQQVLGNVVTVHGPNELPVRTTEVSEIEPRSWKPKVRKFKVPSSIIPDQEMLTMLLDLSSYQAWCCGFANRKPDGELIRTTRNFHLDHIDPISKEGTSNEIVNRAPLCPHHNIRKGNRRIGLAEYRVEIAHAQEMVVNTIGDLIDLSEARHQANEIYAREYARRKNPMNI